jgi:hypothetical protein
METGTDVAHVEQPRTVETEAPPKVIHYSVNAEPQETIEHKLTGRQILERAGFSPAEEYKLVRNDGHKEIGLDDGTPIHEDEAFTATFLGPTPTS